MNPLARLANRWVIVLPGGALYSYDGPIPLDADEDSWDPDLFRTKEEAEQALERLRGEADAIGLIDWGAQVCRLGEAASLTVAAAAGHAPDVDAFNAEHPAPEPNSWTEYAVLTPRTAYRETDDDLPFTTWDHRTYAEARARDITTDWAPRLGVASHQVAIVERTITTTYGPWTIVD